MWFVSLYILVSQYSRWQETRNRHYNNHQVLTFDGMTYFYYSNTEKRCLHSQRPYFLRLQFNKTEENKPLELLQSYSNGL